MSFHRIILKNAIRNGTKVVPYKYTLYEILIKSINLIFILGAVSFILSQPL